MADDIFKPRGATKASEPSAGGAVLRQTPVFGIVKDNIDPNRSGRLQVYISDMGGLDPDDADSWITVNYMTPFYGLTNPSGGNTGYGSYLRNPNSYGMWSAQPDIGTTVICIFINGDPNYGYWIGCVPEPEALHMVPAIGSSELIVANAGEANSFGGAPKLPVMNINIDNDSIADSSNFLREPKPVHSYIAQSLSQQGLIRDTIRGVISSSAQRETPSRVGWGVSTPGRPIYEGGYTDETLPKAAEDGEPPEKLKLIGRRGGHTFVMDDGDLAGRDQLVRLRTALGHQILMSDDGQCLFIIHANGQSWIEMGKEGTIDMYATNSVNIRTQGDLNLHADNDININAKKKLNLTGETVKIASDKETEVRTGTDFKQQTLGKHTLKVTYGMSFESKGEASLVSKNITYINGTKINLNTGNASLVPEEVKPFTLTAHTDTVFDESKGWAAAPGKLLSIVSRAPAHAPWAMANQGVDIKVDNDAKSVFAASPSSSLSSLNNGQTFPSNKVSQAVLSTVPVTGQVSKSLNTNATNALLGLSSTLGAAYAPTAASTGSEVFYNTPLQKWVPAIGKMAQSPLQMEIGGVLKPGSSQVIDKLINEGKTVEQAFSNNLFTGNPGAETLGQYINNYSAQAAAQVNNFQVAQQLLTESGLITGKESSGVIGGAVLTAAIKNPDQVASLAKGLNSDASGTAFDINPNIPAFAQGLVTDGNYATNFAETVSGGLSSIASSLSKLDTDISGLNLVEAAKGVAGSAFNAIVNSFPTIEPGIPQNLKTILEEAQASNEVPEDSPFFEDGLSFNTLNPSTLASGLNALPGAERAVSVLNNTGFTESISQIPTNIPTALKAAIPGITGNVATIPSAIRSITSNLNSAPAGLPGVGPILNTLQGAGKTLDSVVNSALSAANLPAGAAAELTSAISSLSSGGGIQIKLPIVGFNTVDRDSITTQITSILGSPKIPLPPYKGNPATVGKTSATAALDARLAKLKQGSEKTDEINQQVVKIDEAKATWLNAVSDLPAGDPRINSLKQKYYDELDKLRRLQDQRDQYIA